jgi:hypothetical protein
MRSDMGHFTSIVITSRMLPGGDLNYRKWLFGSVIGYRLRRA